MDIVMLVAGVALGVAVPWFMMQQWRRQQVRSFEEREERVRLLMRSAEEKTEAAAREAELLVKSERLRIEEQLNEQYKERREELDRLKQRFDKREEQLDRKFDQLDQREREVDRRRNQVEQDVRVLETRKEACQKQEEEIHRRLEEVAGLTTEQAKAQLVVGLQEDVRRESANFLKRAEDEAKESADRKAQEIIATSIQRLAGEFVAERTVTVVAITSEEMKGRIIGREGRNIRALEAATGCDLIIDDTPEAVVISGFNPVRRQVARQALEELITDGRIHPARIESVVRKAEKNVNNEIREAGERAVFELGLSGIHPDIVKLVGTLKFRTSYTQNVLSHSVEVARFAGMMAEELGLDFNLARRCGLLHDIGKAADHEIQGSHAVIGGQFAKKYKEHPIVVNAIWSHHFDIEPISVYGPLINAADALSAARPGARRENVETYIKRLEMLEGLAMEFPGVEKAFAIQAGRELRVMVAYDRVKDEGAMTLASEIATRVENEMTYPGQIRVTVIREMRATAVAQ
ncbi:MAG: ribonuclease Y [Magnetococcales bacterium]|nr:ribonuclease Y [Magnetococcales bacterium]